MKWFIFLLHVTHYIYIFVILVWGRCDTEKQAASEAGGGQKEAQKSRKYTSAKRCIY